MGRLVFALRSEEGILFGTDSALSKVGPDNDCIFQLDDYLIGAVHTDNEPYEFGADLMAHLLRHKPAFNGDLDEYVARAKESLVQFCKGKAIPPVGFIFAGVDTRTADKNIRVIGVHVARGFNPLPFTGNVFGGMNSIARYLDRKLYSPDMGMTMIKHLALFYISQTKVALPGALDDYYSLAMLLPEKGTVLVPGGEIAEIVEVTRKRSHNLKTACSTLFWGAEP